MNKKLILSIFVLAGAPMLLSAAGEARLLRFPLRTEMRSYFRMRAICIKCLLREVKHNA